MRIIAIVIFVCFPFIAAFAQAPLGHLHHSFGLRLPSEEKLQAEFDAMNAARIAELSDIRTGPFLRNLESIIASHTNTLLHCDATSPKCDWMDLSVFQPPRDQDEPVRCGDCYVFAVAGATEASWLIVRGSPLPSPVELSEEQLLTCATGGCDGGNPYDVLNILQQHYVDAAALTGADHYVGKPLAHCRYNAAAPYKVVDYGTVTRNFFPSNADIKAAIVAHGPVVAAIEATQGLEALTDDRVYSEPTFATGPAEDNPTKVISTVATNHVVVITGWDDSKVDPKNGNALGAWHVRNSWGTDWGQHGTAWISNARGARYLGKTTNNVGYIVWWVTAASVTPGTRGMLSNLLDVRSNAIKGLNTRQQTLLKTQ